MGSTPAARTMSCQQKPRPDLMEKRPFIPQQEKVHEVSEADLPAQPRKLLMLEDDGNDGLPNLQAFF